MVNRAGRGSAALETQSRDQGRDDLSGLIDLSATRADVGLDAWRRAEAAGTIL